ncbi:MAG TPA: hypothetical protein VN327_10615 [Pseudonocardiaceae bacterium]|nr:hypothetical protein [Pseudonocardiaceae bacterium]
MTAEKIVTKLAPLWTDGLACVVCGAAYLRVHVGDVPVGRSGTGSQVFACMGCLPADQQAEPGGVLR